MQSALHTLVQAFRKSLLILVLVGLLSFASWLSPSTQFSYAAHQPMMNQTQDSQSLDEREKEYEEAKEIANDVKMGVEKEYEREVETYQEEHQGEGGIIEEAKELVTKVTGS